MTDTAHRPCPLCGSNEVTPLHPMRFTLPENSPLPPGYSIVACPHCGGVHADTRASQVDYDRYYSDFSHYEDPGVATGGGDSELDATRIADTAGRLLPHLFDKSARILDIGCARGGILKALRQHGFVNLYGVDPSQVCVTHLQSAGIQASRGVLSDPDSLPDHEPFDLIILSHVLEHLLDVSTPLKRLHSRLAPRGLLYVEVPDASHYVDHPAVPFYYFDSEHINHFSRETLGVLARFHGFKVIAGGETDIALPNQRSYPAAWALFEADANAMPSLPTQPPPLAELVRAYIEQSQQAASYPALEALAHEHRPVLLWGAGSYAQRLLEDSPLRQCRIVAIVDQDSNKQGRQFAGTTISAPETGLSNLMPDTVIVVAAALHSAEICARIRNLGYAGEIVLPAPA